MPPQTEPAEYCAGAGSPRGFEKVVRPTSLTSNVADQIRSAIISGRLKLGERLSEATVSEELGVSRTPVREAFLMLKSEGLVDIRPQRGSFVFELNRAEYLEMAEYRNLLEMGSLQLAMRRSPDRLTEGFAEIERANLEALAEGDISSCLALDAQFHWHLIECNSNALLAESYFRVEGRINVMRQRWNNTIEQVTRILRDHQEVIRAAEKRDLTAATRNLSRHILGSKNYQRLL